MPRRGDSHEGKRYVQPVPLRSLQKEFSLSLSILFRLKLSY